METTIIGGIYIYIRVLIGYFFCKHPLGSHVGPAYRTHALVGRPAKFSWLI